MLASVIMEQILKIVQTHRLLGAYKNILRENKKTADEVETATSPADIHFVKRFTL